MKRDTLLACAVALALLALITSFTLGRGDSRRAAVSSGPPAPLECAATWQKGFELKGVVGDRQAQAYFDMWPVPGAPRRVSGVLRFPDERSDEPLADTLIGLEGPLEDDSCVVQLKEADGDTDGSVWRLRFETNRLLTGTRGVPDGRTDAIALDVVPETPCNAGSEWRTFRSARWPIAFEYPASWKLLEDDDDITVECPSIARLATERPSLTFERGRFPSKTTGPDSGTSGSFTEPYWFLRLAGDDWRVCDPDDRRQSGESCPPARRSERNGLVVLQGAAGEHRLYRPGVGYLGQGRGITRFLFIVGERWISLDSAGESSHYDDIGNNGGPVLFDGELIGDRVVRSITARR